MCWIIGSWNEGLLRALGGEGEKWRRGEEEKGRRGEEEKRRRGDHLSSIIYLQ
jgi:hypothetical protein